MTAAFGDDIAAGRLLERGECSRRFRLGSPRNHGPALEGAPGIGNPRTAMADGGWHELERFIDGSPAVVEAYDTATPDFERFVDELDGWFRQQPLPTAELDRRAREAGAAGLATRLALKLAESRRILRGLDAPLTVTLLNPVYKETGRMQRRADHPHGEDSIRHKLKTLRQLESLSDHLTTRLVVVDDECPNDSGRMAQQILRESGDEGESGRHRVLFLREAIDAGDPDLPHGLTHKDGSRRSVKGGALLYAMRKALRHEAAGLHVLVDNDADLSVHPGQIGLLIEDILRGEAQAVAGSRREPDSVAQLPEDVGHRLPVASP